MNQRVARLAWPVIIVVVSFMLAPTASVGAPMASSWDAKTCGREMGYDEDHQEDPERHGDHLEQPAAHVACH